MVNSPSQNAAQVGQNCQNKCKDCSMNCIRILEKKEVRTHASNVLAQSRVLTDLIQREIDVNRSSRCIVIDDVAIYDENLCLLQTKGFSVTPKGSDSCLISW